MKISVEIMLRADPRVYTETFEHPGEPATWTTADMRHVIEGVLRPVQRLLRPGEVEGPVQLRGLNWIVSPWQDGFVIALEIHSASVVAGPFSAPADLLEGLVAGALAPVGPDAMVH